MTDFFHDYLTVGAFIAFGALLGAAMLGLAALIRPSNPNRIKSESYECGIAPVGGGWSQTHIRYYVFALLFLIFDVEAIFLFPWATQAESLGGGPLVVMAAFIATLALGLVYAWRSGVLEWE